MISDHAAWQLSAPFPAELFAKRPACADPDIDPELFFPVGAGYPGQITEAKEVCDSCPVRDGCLTFAVNADVDGIWGGTTREERHAIRRGSQRLGEVAA